MSDPLSKVRPGEKLRIPASAYNAFVDAARYVQSRQVGAESQGTPSGRSCDIVLVKNTSGEDRERFDVLGIDEPIILPDDDEDNFKNRVALKGVMPAEPDHVGKFVILLEPLADEAIGLACVAGVTVAYIDVPDEDYKYPFADIEDQNATALKAKHYGAAAILWREGGTGEQWAVVRIGKPMPAFIFPVNLQQTGGSQGDETTQASWTYDVTDPDTDDTLEQEVDPIASPHLWQRPTVGYIIPATAGYAHYNKDGDLVLGWINEVADQEACDDSTSTPAAAPAVAPTATPATSVTTTPAATQSNQPTGGAS